MTNRTVNRNVIGRIGEGTKIITFKESEFKKELAPVNAIIEHVEINGEEFVRMTYTYD